MELDARTIKKIKKKDRKIILHLYEYTFSVLMSTAVRYKKNEEDQMTIVNNAFMKIINSIDRYQVGTAYFSWVKTIVRNTVIDEFRKEKNYKELFEFETTQLHEEKEVQAEIDENIEAEALQNMLDQLPPATKLVFNLYAIDGFSNKEICDQLDLKYETVKWHIKEARKKLKIILNKEIEVSIESRR